MTITKAKQSLSVLVACLCCIGAVSSATAASLPKGNCADPKPYTDLRHCRFKKADLRNKDLQGVDLRDVELYGTQLQGANLTKALFDGMYITHARLDGITGLPPEALAIFKRSYLVTPNGKSDFLISALPSNYEDSAENVAGLDNIFMVQKVAGTQTTIALLAHPKYAEAPISAIFARFENDKFDFPACYRSVDLMSDGNSYFGPHWESMKVRALPNGGHLIGALAKGGEGDDMGASAWEKLAVLELTMNCKLNVLHEEFVLRSADGVSKNGKQEWCGNILSDFQIVSEQEVDVEITTPPLTEACTGGPNVHKKISIKKIKIAR